MECGQCFETVERSNNNHPGTNSESNSKLLREAIISLFPFSQSTNYQSIFFLADQKSLLATLSTTTFSA